MEKTVADLVVYGKIFTSEGNNKIVEAFAVKDGKFIYVGDESGAEAFIGEGKTGNYRLQRQRAGYAYLRQRSRALFGWYWHSEGRNAD